jgi:hypothetical protein
MITLVATSYDSSSFFFIPIMLEVELQGQRGVFRITEQSRRDQPEQEHLHPTSTRSNAGQPTILGRP